MSLSQPGLRARGLATAVLAALAPLGAQGQGANVVDVELDSSLRYFDNFYFERDETQPVVGAVLAPSVALRRDARRFVFNTRAAIEAGAFSFSNEDNYVDSDTSARLALLMPGEQVLQVDGRFRTDHDPFGTVRTEGSGVEPDRSLDEWQQTQLGASYVIGERFATRMALRLAYDYLDRRYTTNEDVTRFLDRQTHTPSLTASLTLSPKTALLLYVSQSDTDYDETAAGMPDRSGTAQVYAAGVAWEATAKTSGDLRAGTTEWTPEDDAQPERDSFYWEAGLNWNPSLRTRLRLESGRNYRPTYRFNSQFIDERSTTLRWRQSWTARFNSSLSLQFTDRDFVGSGNQQDVFALALRGTWLLDRGLSVYLSNRYVEREAVLDADDFERYAVTVGLSAKLN